MTSKQDVKSTIVKIVKDKISFNNFRWSKEIGLAIEDDTIEIILKADIQSLNMQDNAACFEGWALILKTYVDEYQNKEINKIKLSCTNCLEVVNPKNRLHLNRFLYRVLRFKEQYPWFIVDGKLSSKVNEFKKYLDDNKKNLLNNVPSKDDTKEKTNVLSEHDVESLMLEKEPGSAYNSSTKLASYFKKINPDMLINAEDLLIDHQLPVGLFFERSK